MITLSLAVLEDILPQEMKDDWELGRAWAPAPLLDWWHQALTTLATTSVLTTPWRNPDLVAEELGNPTTHIDVYLCSRASMEALCEIPNALGVHLVSTPDGDPFNDEAPYARRLRVLVVSDKDEFITLTTELSRYDITPHNHQHEYFEAYINTMFHEIAHAVLFAENANMLAPQDIDSLFESGLIGHTVQDCSTGYAIRPLPIHGHLTDADNMDEAIDIMETYVEAQGRIMMLQACSHAAIGQFPFAMGCADDLEYLIAIPA